MRTTEQPPGKTSKNTKPKKSKAEHMRAYRARLRAAGLRPIQIWVPDTRAPGFAEEARRQSLLVAGSKGDKEILDFIDELIDTGGWI